MPIHSRADGETIAYTHIQPTDNKPFIVWLCGYNSDMQGGKAVAVGEWAKANGYGYLAFDYFGHGESSGDLKNGTVSRWREDCLEMIDTHTKGDLILIGSSMGGWMALLTALARKDRVKAMMLIAPAPDFMGKLMWNSFSDAVRAEIMEKGFYLQPSEYGDPYPITRELIEDGFKWSVLDGPIDLSMPVTIIQGTLDAAVPWTHALSVQEKIASTDCVFHLIKDGEHRLSRDQDILRLLTELKILSDKVV